MMTKQIRRAGWLLLLLAFAGCKSLFGNPGVPPDVLFGQRKPIETKAVSGPPVAPPFTEPAAPVNPYRVDR